MYIKLTSFYDHEILFYKKTMYQLEEEKLGQCYYFSTIQIAKYPSNMD